MRAAVAFALGSLLLAGCSAGADSTDPNGETPDAPDAEVADGGPGAPGTPHADPDGGTGTPAPAPDGGVTNDAAAHDAGHDAGHDSGPPNPCPVLTYPSGVKIQTFADPTTTATYAKHLGAGEKAPTCFLDTTRLEDPDTGKSYDLSVQVATHFQLSELVGTEVSEGYGHHVLMAPGAVTALEKFRDGVGVAVSVNSGFRSPLHQEAVCKGLCGNPLGCPGTCANNSRHMFGDAFDLPLEFYTKADEDLACNSGFKFAYLESGTHLHIDQNPAYATCVKE